MTLARTSAGALLEAGVLIFAPDDPITFASGIRSPVYMDIRRLIGDPHAWRTVIEGMGEKLTGSGWDPQVVAGVTVCMAVAGYGFPETLAAFAQVGVELCFLAPFMELLDAAEERGDFPSGAVAQARRWWSDPHGWESGV